MTPVRPALQVGVMEGLPHLPLELRRRVEAIAAAENWLALDREGRAMALAAGRPVETWGAVEALAAESPRDALELALLAGRWGLRFLHSHGRVVRVLQPVRAPSAGELAPASVWRAIRRVLAERPACEPGLREALADEEPTDVRVRAGVAHVLWSDPERWTERDQAAALAVVDLDAGAHLLLAWLRAAPGVEVVPTWPPPVELLGVLPDAEFLAASRCYPRGAADSARGDRMEAQQYLHGASHFLAAMGEPGAIARLVQVVPSASQLARAASLAPAPGTVEAALHDYLLGRWRAAHAQGRAAPPARTGTPAGVQLEGLRLLDWAFTRRPRRADPPALHHLGTAPEPWAGVVARLLAWADLAVDRELGRVCIQLLGQQRTRASLQALVGVGARTEDRHLRRMAARGLELAATAEGAEVGVVRERLFPDLTVPEGCRAALDDDGGVQLEVLEPVLSMPGVSPPPARTRRLSGAWKEAADALPALLRRLERLMAEGAPLTALHFTETWAMHPLLRLVAERVLWGVFDGERRVALLVPGRHQPVAPDEHHGVRPVHPVELTASELAQARALIPGPQPILQLERPTFAGEWMDEGVCHLDTPRVVRAFSAPGWSEVGPYVYERRGGDWRARLMPLAPEGPGATQRLVVTPVERVPRRVLSQMVMDIQLALRVPLLKPRRSFTRARHHR